jgi:hypothetical protein
MEYPLLDGVSYVMPHHARFSPRHKKLEEAETRVQCLRSDSRQRLAVALHEANHKIVAEQLGLTATYAGPAIEHFRDSNSWLVSLGRTFVLSDEYERLSVEQAARFHVAGRVAETVLLGSALNEPSEESDCEQFIYSGRGNPSQLIAIWKRTEETMLQELQNDLEAQRRIVYEAQKCEQEIFPDCLDSVREKK